MNENDECWIHVGARIYFHTRRPLTRYPVPQSVDLSKSEFCVVCLRIRTPFQQTIQFLLHHLLLHLLLLLLLLLFLFLLGSRFIHRFYRHLCRLDSFTFFKFCQKSMTSTSSHVAAYRALKILLFVERSRREWQCCAIDKKVPDSAFDCLPFNSRDYRRTYRSPSIDQKYIFISIQLGITVGKNFNGGIWASSPGWTKRHV